jgi:hypothetical protein
VAEVRIPAAGDPFHAAGRERYGGGAHRFTEKECREAIAEEEARLGHPMSQQERQAFARAFFADDSRDEIRRLAMPCDPEGEA